VDKRTALTYIDANGNWHRASKGAPEQVNFPILSQGMKLEAPYSRTFFSEQILTLCGCKEDVKKRVHAAIAKYADCGLRSLAVARQVCVTDILKMCSMGLHQRFIVLHFGICLPGSTGKNKRKSRGSMAVCWFTALV